jgi:threonine dehydratase
MGDLPVDPRRDLPVDPRRDLPVDPRRDLPVDPDDVAAAHRRIEDAIVRTPVVPADELTRRIGAEVAWKLEGVQPTGSFKVRGAASVLLGLDVEAARRGVVTASTGNHGRAVAHVAARTGIPVTVCVSVHVPPGKVAALHALGCEVVIGGDSQSDALLEADRLVTDRGLTLVHPFDDPRIIAGQGTVGRELMEQAPGTSHVLVPLSGGGLAAGIAVAVKAVRPDVRVVGVSMERAPVMAMSLDAGRPVDLPEQPTLADSLQGGIGRTNVTTFPIVQALLDDIVLVSEQQIWDGMRFAFDHHRLLLEGGGAVGIAALLAGLIEVGRSDHVAVIASGANAESGQIEALARGDDRPPG